MQSHVITCNDKKPPWLSKEIKNANHRKSRALRNFLQRGRRESDKLVLKSTTEEYSNLVSSSKEKYLSRLGAKLNNPLIAPKTYWSVLNNFLGKRKIPLIPPLLFNGLFVTDFKCKANMFNNFFANQCKVIENSSALPLFSPVVNSNLDHLIVDPLDIISIIKSLKPNKAHGWDEISVRMVSICGEKIVPPLMLIFSKCIATSTYPEIWKKANVAPVHKKNSKNDMNNYRPISLLPIFSKIFEKIIFNAIFKHLESNNLLANQQSGFRPGDSCVNQLLSITHEIFSAFDCNPSMEVRGVFLDISKAFDKVWHKGLLLKLRQHGLSGKLLALIENFLSARQQRVVLNGQCSEWKDVSAGVPQGSVLGPLFFLIYINDLPDGLLSNVKIFADDTSLFSVVKDPIISSSELNHDLGLINYWAHQWKMSFNPDKSKQAVEITFSRKRSPPYHPPITFNHLHVAKEDVQKHLGLYLDKQLNFQHHLKEKISKANKGIGVIKRLSPYLPRASLISIYKMFVRPHLDYADIIYDRPNNDIFKNKLESVQYNAALAITGAIRGTSMDKLFSELGFEYLADRRWLRRLSFLYKIQDNSVPKYLSDIIPSNSKSMYSTRNKDRIRNFSTRTDLFSFSFFPCTIRDWNILDPSICASKSLSIFKSKLLKFIRPKPYPIYGIHDPLGLKYLTRLRLGFSHLHEHKFRHNFRDTINPLCPCNLESETTSHFLLRCTFFICHRKELFDSLELIDPQLTRFNVEKLVTTLLFGDVSYSPENNATIILASIKYILDTNRFSNSLF